MYELLFRLINQYRRFLHLEEAEENIFAKDSLFKSDLDASEARLRDALGKENAELLNQYKMYLGDHVESVSSNRAVSFAKFGIKIGLELAPFLEYIEYR